jgi:hypothetical protein
MPFESKALRSSSADKIAEYVLQKTAVTRWREAIYSGELPLEQREKLKAHMGATPEKYREGLLKGDLARTQGRGYKINNPEEAVRSMLGDVRKKGLKGLPSSERMIEALPTLMGSHTNLGSKNINLSPHTDRLNFMAGAMKNKKVPLMSRLRTIKDLAMNRDMQKDFDAYVRHHEVGEATTKPMRGATRGMFQVPPDVNLRSPSAHMSSALAGFGTGYLAPMADADLGKQIARNAARNTAGPARGMHMSPEVLLEELRSSRMQSPNLQNVQSNLRGFTGEYGKGVDPSKLVVPSSKTPAYRSMAANMQQQADKAYAPIEETASRWFNRGQKARPFIENQVQPKLKGLLSRLKSVF